MQKEIVPSTKQPHPLKVLAHQKTEINVFIFGFDVEKEKNIYYRL